MRFSDSSLKVCLWVCFLFAAQIVAAQTDPAFEHTEPVEVSITVGDTLVLGKPKSPTVFAFIDIFRKTRWDPNPLPNDEFTRKYKTYDSATGNGFYRYFFRGDFDAAELPAAYEGRKFRIKGIEVVSKEKDGSPMNVIYLETERDDTIIMVDIDNAAEFGEIENVIFSAQNSKMR
jgi:hypothetical protein